MNYERAFRKAVFSGDVCEIQRLSSMFYEDYCRLVYHVVYSILQNEEEAKDATSEAFVSFLQHLEDIKHIKNAKYYLLSSARYIAYRMKKKREEINSYDEDDGLFNNEERIPETLDAVALLSLVRKVLTKEEIGIVLGHLEDGMSFREIANTLHQTPDAISGKYSRAIQKIQKARRES